MLKSDIIYKIYHNILQKGEYKNERRIGHGVLTSEIDGWSIEGTWSQYTPPPKEEEVPSGGFGFFKKLASQAKELVVPKDLYYEITTSDGLKAIYKRKDHTFSGSTRLIWPDGKIYVGEVDNNLPHGEGEVLINEKLTFKGKWIDGKYLGEKTIQDLEIESTEATLLEKLNNDEKK